jgi:hypothetical protein
MIAPTNRVPDRERPPPLSSRTTAGGSAVPRPGAHWIRRSGCRAQAVAAKASDHCALPGAGDRMARRGMNRGNEKLARPGDIRDFRALGGDIGAGRSIGTPGQATCKRQASGSKSAQLPSPPEMSARSGAPGSRTACATAYVPQRDVLAGEHLLNVGVGTRLGPEGAIALGAASRVGKSCGPAA